MFYIFDSEFGIENFVKKMADYVFKVQVLLPGNVLETVILRQYIDPVDRCFDRFKTNLIQRYDILTNSPFKMMWIGECIL